MRALLAAAVAVLAFSGPASALPMCGDDLACQKANAEASRASMREYIKQNPVPGYQEEMRRRQFNAGVTDADRAALATKIYQFYSAPRTLHCMPTTTYRPACWYN